MKKIIIDSIKWENDDTLVKRSNTLYLLFNSMNDSRYHTYYYIIYIDNYRHIHNIGHTKIGLYSNKNYDENYQSKNQHIAYYELDNNMYFSLGQDESYYENLIKLGDPLYKEILVELNDVVYNNKLYNLAKDFKVFKKSLALHLSHNTITQQFRNILINTKITQFEFNYAFPATDNHFLNNNLNFNINYSDNNNNNIYAFIGSNGIGKSHLLSNIINASLEKEDKDYGKISFGKNSSSFSRIIFVSYSNFDTRKFDFKEKNNTKCLIPYNYIGFEIEDIEESEYEVYVYSIIGNNDKIDKKDPTFIFLHEFSQLINNKKFDLWIKAINILDTDTILKENILDFINTELTYLNYSNIQKSQNILYKFYIKFESLSSGHKIILFTITKILNRIYENCLLIFDEPELHLHPPLISAYINSLTYILSERNAIGIIATHSPVVLQELKKDNVFKFNRINEFIKISNPKIETYGENIGSITNDVFNLEIKNSGYYKNLKELVSTGLTYEDILNKLNNNLGDEGKSILNMLIHYRYNSNL